MTPEKALEWAVEIGARSACAKSKRGVVIFREVMLARASNGPPTGFRCDGSEACRGACNKVAVHAEERALVVAARGQCSVVGAEMLHVKVVDGAAVPSGEPSCWQCSRTVLEAGIAAVWLLRPSGLVRYPAHAFHLITLRSCELPSILEQR